MVLVLVFNLVTLFVLLTVSSVRSPGSKTSLFVSVTGEATCVTAVGPKASGNDESKD